MPARVAGNWEWELQAAGRRFQESVLLEQRFQKLEGVARAGDRREVLQSTKLRGEDIAFSLTITLESIGQTQHEFTGKVAGNEINGSVKMTPANQPTITVPWRAQRTTRARYFEPTGTGAFTPER